MRKITTFLALLLTCIIGATAADFVPKVGTKYLIKCKGDNNVVYTPENSNILKYQQSVSDASYFTIESKVVENVTYFYIHPAGDAAKYVYTAKTPSNDNNANDGVVGVTSTADDATCLWKITFNKGNNNPCAFNITPKGYDNYSWNCRSNGIGYWHTGGNNQANNSWYITPNVELNGYYTIKNTATDRRTNLYNDFGVDKITRAAQELPTTLTNNYVWHVTTAKNNVLTVLNGEGTPLYHDGDVSDASLPTLNVAYSDGTKYYFGEALNCGNSGRNFKLTLWKDGDYSVADNQWTFAPVEVSNIYNVVCNIADGYVTYNSTSEKAKNGGFFNIATAPAAGDFTAKELTGYDVAVSIEGNNINVNYTYNLETVKQLANEALAKTGAGYPTADAATRTALLAAVAGTDAATIATALDAYKKDKTSIQMPEDGKAYVITNIHKTGGKRYMKYTADGTSMIARGEGELPIEATYICHKVGDKYVFANNSGTYLTWRGNATGDCTNDNKGFTTSYDADYNTFTVAANPDVFGCLSFGAKRNNDQYPQSYYIVTKTGAFDKADLRNFYDDKHSSAFTFEEVTYPNTITFHDAQNINGVSYIATFSAPFATIIPAGVKAYYVSAKGAEATMTAIDAQVIPANQGVILTSESGAAATMVPAASETAATITGNQLGHSAGAAQTLTAGEGYILGNGSEGTAFYPCKAGSLPINKAYLLGNGESSAIVMNFGNAVTGINTIAAPASSKAPIFDLSGRRVVKATKGLYIQNGKKVIVK